MESTPKRGVEYRLLHGLYGVELFTVLDDMKSFLDQHVNEIIILDFQHMFSCLDQDHQTIIERIKTTFGSKLLEQSKEIPTLKEMQVSGHLIYTIDKYSTVLFTLKENNFQLLFLGQTKHIMKPLHCYTYALLSRRHNIILLEA